MVMAPPMQPGMQPQMPPGMMHPAMQHPGMQHPGMQHPVMQHPAMLQQVRPMAAPQIQPPQMPPVQLPPGLDRAVAEIAARRRALNGEQPGQEPPAQAFAPAAPPPAFAPVPTQDLSGLEEHLRQITDQIETLRRPGVEEAINALRQELGDIGRALNEAMPRRAIDTIEKQIAGLTQRIAEGRQSGNIAGIDAGALAGVEHGLAEVRDALRGLTPAENLVGFNDAVNALAHKIDLIVAQKDPETLGQLEHAITTLRDMASHVASDEAIGRLAAQVQMLGDKVEHFASSGGASDALNNLEHRIAALADALAERTQSGATVPPRLEALVQSLSDKIEQIQQSRGDNIASGHLEDQIVALVQRLDASDSQLGHLEAIERGLADLLVHIEEMRANKGTGALREENSPAVAELRQGIARTQDALDAVNGTLGHVVDRLAMIERDFRGEARPRPPADDEPLELRQPVGRVVARMITDEPPPPDPAPAAQPAPMPPPVIAAPPPPPPPPVAAQPAPPPPPAAPRRLPPAAHLPINPNLPPDQPLEPGSGRPPLRANPAARIAASEAALGGAQAAGTAPSGRSGFIAAARRAAQTAIETATPRTPPAAPEALDGEPAEEGRSPRTSIVKRMKSLFVAASIVAIVVGLIQIASNVIDFGGSNAPATRTAKAPDRLSAATPLTTATVKQAKPSDVAANALQPPSVPDYLNSSPIARSPLAPSPMAASPNPGTAAAPLTLNPKPQSAPSLLNPPMLGASGNDITGSIPHPTGKQRPARSPQSPPLQDGELPDSIGSEHLRKAAQSGNAAAAYEIAVRYAEGRGVAASLQDAARWYERAAGKGLAPAQFRYASMLEKGQGLRKDLGQARRLYQAAAAKGHAKAMHNLAVLYAEGIEGKPDYATAAQWFRKAAQHGIPDSQYNLGVLCARGLGTGKDMAEAYKWFALAANQGDREAAKKRDDVAGQLDAEALAAAQLAVKTFKAVPQPHEAIAVPAPAGGWDSARTVPTAAPAAAPAAAPLPLHKPRAPRALSLNSFTTGNR
jgi:localization factor PodJL